MPELKRHLRLGRERFRRYKGLFKVRGHWAQLYQSSGVLEGGGGRAANQARGPIRAFTPHIILRVL